MHVFVQMQAHIEYCFSPHTNHNVPYKWLNQTQRGWVLSENPIWLKREFSAFHSIDKERQKRSVWALTFHLSVCCRARYWKQRRAPAFQSIKSHPIPLKTTRNTERAKANSCYMWIGIHSESSRFCAVPISLVLWYNSQAATLHSVLAVVVDFIRVAAIKWVGCALRCFRIFSVNFQTIRHHQTKQFENQTFVRIFFCSCRWS